MKHLWVLCQKALKTLTLSEFLLRDPEDEKFASFC